MDAVNGHPKGVTHRQLLESLAFHLDYDGFLERPRMFSCHSAYRLRRELTSVFNVYREFKF